MVGNRHWDDQEKRILRKHFPYISSPKLSEALKERSSRSVEGQARRMGLHKVPERIAEMARENLRKTPKPPPPNGAA
jgi:hypothetical protein